MSACIPSFDTLSSNCAPMMLDCNPFTASMTAYSGDALSMFLGSPKSMCDLSNRNLSRYICGSVLTSHFMFVILWRVASRRVMLEDVPIATSLSPRTSLDTAPHVSAESDSIAPLLRSAAASDGSSRSIRNPHSLRAPSSACSLSLYRSGSALPSSRVGVFHVCSGFCNRIAHSPNWLLQCPSNPLVSVGCYWS